MRPSNKSRSRNHNHNHNHNKNNNRRGGAAGNIVNRVFDSAGPEGRVRGTPQQIIDKYQGLAHDAQLSGDRVAAESYLQHAEHYSRMLGEAQREMTEKREAQEAQRKQNNNNQSSHQNNRNNDGGGQDAQNSQNDPSASDQPDVYNQSSAEMFPMENDDSNLVHTPESQNPKNSESRPMVPVAEMQANVEVVEIKKATKPPEKKVPAAKEEQPESSNEESSSSIS